MAVITYTLIDVDAPAQTGAPILDAFCPGQTLDFDEFTPVSIEAIDADEATRIARWAGLDIAIVNEHPGVPAIMAGGDTGLVVLLRSGPDFFIVTFQA